LAEQDRSRWDQDLIREGVALVTAALSQGPIGSYQVQAAIAAVHDEAAKVEETDWAEVLALYETLDRISANPMATLNRAVAEGMVNGPDAGLDLLVTIEGDPRVSGNHLLYAVRGHLLEMASRPQPAGDAFEMAARRTSSLPEKRYLQQRARQVRAGE
jgi:predicted RNA polymerase sigma factor